MARRSALVLMASCAAVTMLIAGCTASSHAHGAKPRRSAPAAGSTSPPATNAPTPNTSTRHHPPGVLSWRPSVVAGTPVMQETLVGSRHALYGMVQGRTNALVRIDPATGRITARRAVSRYLRERPLIWRGDVWLVSAPQGRPTLVEYTPGLRISGRTPLGVSDGPIPLAALALEIRVDMLFAVVGDEFVQVSPGRRGPGKVVSRYPGPGTTVTAAAVDPIGGIYVAAHDRVFDLRYGRWRAVGRSYGGDGTISDLAAFGGVWVVHGEGMGESVLIQFPGSRRVKGVAGGYSTALPSVTIAAGTAWLGSPQQLACAAPDTGRVLARTPLIRYPGRMITTNSIALVGHRAFALRVLTNPSRTELVRLHAPTRCFR